MGEGLWREEKRGGNVSRTGEEGKREVLTKWKGILAAKLRRHEI